MSCGSGNCGLSLLGCGVVLAGVLLGILATGTGRAADIETRDFQVTVAGKHAGEVHMTIHRQDNGVIQMRCDTDIHVHMVVRYKFIYRGHETWKDGRLQRLDSNTDDNGKRYIVSAVAEETGLRIRVNNVERIARPDIWLTSYWCLPEPKVRDAVLAIIDADNGKDLSGKLQFIANEKHTIAGQQVALNHYRLVGPSLNVDLWFDGSERLVRQEWVEQGHRTILELLRVRR
jgi:hypothetical protein